MRRCFTCREGKPINRKDAKNGENVFATAWSSASPTCAPLSSPADEARRIDLWRRQEWHNWFRWSLCRKGFDWSKPIVIATLAVGFGALIIYGYMYDRWYITAGGIVGWFTVVNLAFFAYFGLTLPGPPLPLPGPVQPGHYRAEMGLY